MRRIQDHGQGGSKIFIFIMAVEWFLGREDSLEKEMAIDSSIFAWKIPWAEEPGGLQSMGSQSHT